MYAPSWEGAAEFDARQPMPVIRHPTSMMLPVPSVRRRAVAALAEHGCDSVLFGAAAPLGLLAPALRRAGAKRIVAITHGHEAGWAALPGARGLLRRIGDDVDVVTYLGEYFRVRLARALSPAAAARMVRLAPGVDSPRSGPDRAAPRSGGGSASSDRPVVLCVSRLVPRKGQDTLLRAWPEVLAAAPDAALLLVGSGPFEKKLRNIAERLRLNRSVYFAGPSLGGAACLLRRRRRVRHALPDAARRARRRGPGHRLPGGLGDRAAGGRRRLRRRARCHPATASRGTWCRAAAWPRSRTRITGLVTDPARARAMGEKGLAWVQQEWRWDLVAGRLEQLLRG